MSKNTKDIQDAETVDAVESPIAKRPQQGGAPSLMPTASPMQMIDRALSNGAGIEVLEKLFDLQQRYEASESKKAFNNAIADAKAEIKPIVKDGHVHYKSKDSNKPDTDFKHETLAGIAKQIDPILSKFGLSYRYRSDQLEGGMIRVTCILSHRDGYSEETALQGSRDDSGSKNNYQAVGSAATYLQRYTIKLALGLSAANDDDAEKAANNGKPETISADQYIELQRLIEESGVPEDVVCAAQSVPHLENILAAEYPRITKKLRITIENKAKAKAAEEAE